MAKSLEQEIQAAKDAIAKTKAAEAKAKAEKEATAKKEAADQYMQGTTGIALA
jgi:hypothetical protein